MTLPVSEMVLYKHGVGFFVREGQTDAERITLTFKTPEINDILKSLALYDRAGGQVRSVRYQTPTDRLANNSVKPGKISSLLGLLIDLRGRRIRVTTAKATYEGVVIGLDNPSHYGGGDPTPPMRLSLLSDEGEVQVLDADAITRVRVLDEQADADLRFFLETVATTDARQTITLDLSEGEHDLVMYYVAPSPTWRVSYRLLTKGGAATLQGWALFDNTLEEDLKDVKLTLVAGQPISFVYQLFDSSIPGRPVVEDAARVLQVAPQVESWKRREDEERKPAGGMSLLRRIAPSEGMLGEARTPAKRARVTRTGQTAGGDINQLKREVQRRMVANSASVSRFAPPTPEEERKELEDALEEVLSETGTVMSRSARQRLRAQLISEVLGGPAVEVDVETGQRGEHFQYQVGAPVSVKRGDSAMVPILSTEVGTERELLYNPEDGIGHPVAAFHLTNDTGLTLEHGPVTVITDGSYQGEAVMPFARNGAEVFLPYAVELGINVAQHTTETRAHHRLAIEGHTLVFEEHRIRATTTRFDSNLDEDHAVILMGAVDPLLALFDTPEPFFTSATERRWRVTVEGNGVTTFTSKERELTERRDYLGNLSEEALRQYLNKRWLDADTFERLAEYIQLDAASSASERRVQALKAEREAIYERQEQIRRNLQALQQGEGREGALYERMLGQLEATEDQIDAIAEEEESLRAEAEEAATRMEEIIAGLNED